MIRKLTYNPYNINIFDLFYWEKAFYYLRKFPHKIPSIGRLLLSLPLFKRIYYGRKDNIIGPPFFVIVRPTNRCNLRCKQCGQWGDRGIYKNLSQNSPDFDELSFNDWRKLIDDIARFHPYIAFFGGEPFLRRDLVNLIEYASKKGLLSWVSTNGTLLSSQAKYIIKSGLDYIYVSLDGPQEINDKIRIGNNVYNKVVDGVDKILVERKRHSSCLPIIEIQMTVFDENQEYILETSRIAKQLGVDNFSVRLPMFTTPQLKKQAEDRFYNVFNKKLITCDGFIRDYKKINTIVIKQQINIVQKEWGARFRPLPLESMYKVEEHFFEPQKPLNIGKCIIPWVRAQIMPNGDMVLCEDFPELIVGNIKDSSFKDLWNSDIYLKFRKFIKEEGILPICTRCCGLYEVPHYETMS